LGLWRRLRGTSAGEPGIDDVLKGTGVPALIGQLNTGAESAADVGSVATVIEAAIDNGDLEGARSLLDASCASTSHDGALMLQLARVQRLSGQPQAALVTCDAALPVTYLPSAVQTERAQALLALSDLEGAVDALHVALELDDRNGDAWLLMGQILQRVDSRADALSAYERSSTLLTRASDVACALRRIGSMKIEAMDAEGARQAFVASLKIEPDNADAHLGLGMAALWVDDEQTALSHLESALARTARPSNGLLMNLAYALQHTGRLDEAHAVYSRLIAKDPRDHAVRWYLCQLDLTLCNWKAGWGNIQSRFTSGAASYRPIGYRPWDGRDIRDQTLLVFADEGLGDEIMYASCIPDAQARAGCVVLECEPRLLGLFSRSFPGVKIVATRRESNPGWLDGYPKPDWQLPSGALPAIFRQSDRDFPGHSGYLKADSSRVEYWRAQLALRFGDGLKVGISWRGGTARTRQRARTIAAHEWAPILATQGVQFINLQYGDYKAELATLNEIHGGRIHDLPQALTDYDETAALVEALDLVITVCTAVVHLSGALGRPVWILTPLVPGWRYTANRSAMPWYPSSRLFRQSTWGNWQPVCQEVSDALAELTKSVT
jgi:tetratricopeptide (TPR) repeat protein